MDTVSEESRSNSELKAEAISANSLELDKKSTPETESSEREKNTHVISVCSEKETEDLSEKDFFDGEIGRPKKKVPKRRKTTKSIISRKEQSVTEHLSVCSEPLKPRPPEKKRPHRPSSACSVSSTASSRRRPAFRPKTHDDLLNEHYRELAELLKDNKQPSVDRLRQQHRVQTLNLINDYHKLSGGSTPRSILISRSLPESMRSPRSRPHSAAPSPRGSARDSHSTSRRGSVDSYRSYSSSRSSKRVTFNTANSVKPTDDISAAQMIEQVIIQRSKMKVQPRHAYQMSDLKPLDIQSKVSKKLRPKSVPSSSESTPRSTSTINTLNSERLNGSRLAESPNVKDTGNPLVKAWAIQKEKEIRAARRKQRADERKKREIEEVERQRSEERKLDAQHAVKIWRAQKRVEASNARKVKRQATGLIGKVRESPVGKESSPEGKLNATLSLNVTNDFKKDSSSSRLKQNKNSSAMKLKRPQSAQTSKSSKTKILSERVPEIRTEKQKIPKRPYSAPPVRTTKPSQVTIQTIIDNSPALQKKIKDLEREKKLKHRKSHDEWVKIKEREKREELKQIQQRRERIEREISEETARLISEAARKRVDQIKSQYPTKEEREQNTAKSESPKKPKDENPYYQWRATHNKAKDILNNTKPSTSKETPQKNNASSRRNIEESIGSTYNPFKEPDKPRRSNKVKPGILNRDEFSHFIRDLGKKGNPGPTRRPEPQGADAPKQPREESSKAKQQQQPANLSSSPKDDGEVSMNKDPVIETGRTIFSMTSIET